MQTGKLTPKTAFLANHAEEGFFAAANQEVSQKQPKSTQTAKFAFNAWVASTPVVNVHADSPIQGYCLMLQGCTDYYLFIGTDLKIPGNTKHLYLLPSTLLKHAEFAGEQSVMRGHCPEGTPWSKDSVHPTTIPAFCQIRATQEFSEDAIRACQLPVKSLPLMRLALSGHWSDFYKPLFLYQNSIVVIGPSVSALLGQVVRKLTLGNDVREPQSDAIEKLTLEIETLFDFLQNDFFAISNQKQEQILQSLWFKKLSQAAVFYNQNIRQSKFKELQLLDCRSSRRPDSKQDTPFMVNNLVYLGADLLDLASSTLSTFRETELFKALWALNNASATHLVVMPEGVNKLHPLFAFDGCPYFTTVVGKNAQELRDKLQALEEISGLKLENYRLQWVSDFNTEHIQTVYDWDFKEALNELDELKYFSRK